MALDLPISTLVREARRLIQIRQRVSRDTPSVSGCGNRLIRWDTLSATYSASRLSPLLEASSRIDLLPTFPRSIGRSRRRNCPSKGAVKACDASTHWGSYSRLEVCATEPAYLCAHPQLSSVQLRSRVLAGRRLDLRAKLSRVASRKGSLVGVCARRPVLLQSKAIQIPHRNGRSAQANGKTNKFPFVDLVFTIRNGGLATG